MYLEVWDTATGVLITDELTEISDVDQMLFSPDNSHLLFVTESTLEIIMVP